jgi:hypothetical protein
LTATFADHLAIFSLATAFQAKLSNTMSVLIGHLKACNGIQQRVATQDKHVSVRHVVHVMLLMPGQVHRICRMCAVVGCITIQCIRCISADAEVEGKVINTYRCVSCIATSKQHYQQQRAAASLRRHDHLTPGSVVIKSWGSAFTAQLHSRFQPV